MSKIQKNLFRIISLLLVLITIISLVVPAFAATTGKKAITIASLPDEVTVAAGKTASVKITAISSTGAELKYQWYFSEAGSSKEYKSSITGSTYKVTMAAARNGRKVYCVVSDGKGNSVKSEVVTLRLPAPTVPKITVQPKNTSVLSGATAKVSVTATGEGPLTYAWYFASPKATKFTKSSVTTSTYKVTMSAARSGRRVYCVVTDANGDSVTSNTVTLTLAKPVTVTHQPKNVEAGEGKVAYVTTRATGEGKLTYQWYVRKPGGQKFYASSVTGPTYSAKMTSAVNGRQVYCVITDQYGQKATTNTVTISFPPPIAITRQPADAKVFNGKLVSVSVQASSQSTLIYQWYVCKPGGKQFYKSSVTGSTYTAKMSDAVNGRQVYCLITDTKGQQVKSKTVTLSAIRPITITQQPEDVKVLSGKAATISVEATGEGKLSYQWYIRNKGRKDFYKSSATFSTYSPIMSDAVDGREVYCVISDNYGQSVQTRTVTLLDNPDGLHVLIVGNSHSLDAFWFLRNAWMDLDPNADLCIGILYYSGGSISEHVAAAKAKQAVNRYYKNNDGKWIIEHDVTHEYILNDQEWDIIMMQPGKEDIIHPTLNKTGRYQLAEYIDTQVENPHQFVWHITWPCPNDETFYSPDYIRQPPEGYKDRLIALYDFNPVNQYTEKLDMTKKHILNDPLYTKRVNSGAAVMQAHLTQGVPQLDLYRDYTHLNDFGRLMVGYSLAAQLSGKQVKAVGIDRIDVRSRWYTYKPLGDLIVTKEMKNIIIEAANYSLKSPWELPKKAK